MRNNRSIWRWIVATVGLSLVVVGATSISLRALAQQQPADAPAADPPAVESNEIAPDPDAPPAASQDDTELPPELRDSADNNLSFPVDI